jgi:hypothetical protein
VNERFIEKADFLKMMQVSLTHRYTLIIQQSTSNKPYGSTDKP